MISNASGSFLLRLDPALHGHLRQAAADEGLSLNRYCARKLALPSGSMGAWEGLEEVISRILVAAGDGLVGALLHGSWVRGEATLGSDIDLLVVLEREVPLRPALYRSWDEVPLHWHGRPVEPGFVHLPGDAQLPSALWAEVALDGLVLFERGLRITRRLISLRHDIAAGRILRREVQGRSYWVLPEEADHAESRSGR